MASCLGGSSRVFGRSHSPTLHGPRCKGYCLLVCDLQVRVKCNILYVGHGWEEGCWQGFKGFEGLLPHAGGSCAVSHPQVLQAGTDPSNPRGLSHPWGPFHPWGPSPSGSWAGGDVVSSGHGLHPATGTRLPCRDVLASSAPQLQQPGPAFRFRWRLEPYFQLQSATTQLRELQCKPLSYCWCGKALTLWKLKCLRGGTDNYRQPVETGSNYSSNLKITRY